MPLISTPAWQFSKPGGEVLAFAKAYTYLGGTTTLNPVYQDVGCTIPHTNPVVADDQGLFPAMYNRLDESIRVKLVSATGTLVDPILDFDYVASATDVPDLAFKADVEYVDDGLALKADADDVAAALEDVDTALDLRPLKTETVLNIGLKSTADGATIPIDIDRVITVAYDALGKGSGTYVVDASLDAGDLAAHPRAIFQSADDRYWRLDGTRCTVQEFGGKEGDDAFNNSPALLAASRWAEFRGIELFIIGALHCVETVTAGSIGSLAVIGAGRVQSQIIFPADSNFVYDGGIPVEYGSKTLSMAWMSMRIRDGVSDKALLQVLAEGGIGSTAIGFDLEDMEFSGVTEDDGFEYAVESIDCRNVSIQDVRILGDRGWAVENPSEVINPASKGGIRVYTDLLSEGTEVNMWNVETYFVDKAWEFQGAFEGIVIDGCTAAVVGYGVYSNRDQFPGEIMPGGDPLVVVVNTHVSAIYGCIYLRNRFQSFITGCLLYSQNITGDDFYIIDVVSEAPANLFMSIIGNIMRDGREGTDTLEENFGIRIDATIEFPGSNKTSIIEGNIFERLDTAITLGTYASFVTVGPTNLYETSVTTPVVVSGAGNRVHVPMVRQSDNQAALQFCMNQGITAAFSGASFYPYTTGFGEIGNGLLRWGGVYANVLNAPVIQFGGGIIKTFGTGSPEGVVTGAVGSEFTRVDGGAGEIKYLKLVGTGNTGWYPEPATTARMDVLSSGTTPSVEKLSKVIRLDYAGATTITALTGMNEGDERKFYANNSNVTFQHNGTTIFLKTGANTNVPGGSSIKFLCTSVGVVVQQGNLE